MLDVVYKETKNRMKKIVDETKESFSKVRTGRANPSILDEIKVDYYGSPTPINQMSNISVPEPNLIVIQPWDKSTLKNLEKAILKSDIGLNPMNDGEVIRLPFPQLTEERRKELVKKIRDQSEEQRVAIRNIRRDANDQVEKLEDNGDISEDELHRSLDKIQDLTDEHIDQINDLFEKKEDEIMTL